MQITFHPGVMMLRKDSYWLAGGCDEDFVGAYGQTDPHFRWRASNTGFPTKLLSMRGLCDAPTCTTVHAEKPPLALEPMTNENKTAYTCPLPLRNVSRNKMLFLSKKAHKIPWTKTFLRFKWHIATAPDGSQLARRLAKRRSS